MQSRFLVGLAGTSIFSLSSAQDSASPRAVRYCDRDLLPEFGDDRADWSCMGNSCGVTCAETGKFFKNQMFCNVDLEWVQTGALAAADINCDAWPREPKFEPECDISTAPDAGINGIEAGRWVCDKRFRKCKLDCDNDVNAKTKIVCDTDTDTWTLMGRNSCDVPTPKYCDVDALPDYGDIAVFTCRKGKSCHMECNGNTIQGALTCKAGVWTPRKEQLSCCDNSARPEVASGIWECKSKKYSTTCRLTCTNGKKGRTLLKCEGSEWVQYGHGVCEFDKASLLDLAAASEEDDADDSE